LSSIQLGTNQKLMSAYLNSLLLSKDLNAEGGRRGKGMGAQTCWYHLAYLRRMLRRKSNLKNLKNKIVTRPETQPPTPLQTSMLLSPPPYPLQYPDPRALAQSIDLHCAASSNRSGDHTRCTSASTRARRFNCSSLPNF